MRREIRLGILCEAPEGKKRGSFFDFCRFFGPTVAFWKTGATAGFWREGLVAYPFENNRGWVGNFMRMHHPRLRLGKRDRPLVVGKFDFTDEGDAALVGAASLLQAGGGAVVVASPFASLAALAMLGATLAVALSIGLNKLFDWNQGLPPTHLLMTLCFGPWALVLILKASGRVINRAITGR